MTTDVMEPEVEETESAPVEAVEAEEQAEQPEEQKPEAVSPEQANKAIGKVTLYEEAIERITGLQFELEDIEDTLETLRKRNAKLRKDRDTVITKLSALHKDLRDIKNGQYQRKLFTGMESKPEKEKPVDPGTVTPIDNLGMSEKETELLIGVDIKTVADLELKMRTDPWWHKKIKGFGQAKVDKLSDRLIEWRKLNPVPTEEDKEEEDPIATDRDSSDVEASAAEESEVQDAFDQEEDEELGDDE